MEEKIKKNSLLNGTYKVHSHNEGYVLVKYTYKYKDLSLSKYIAIDEKKNAKDDYYITQAKSKVESGKIRGLKRHAEKTYYFVNATPGIRVGSAIFKIAMLGGIITGGVFTVKSLIKLSGCKVIFNAGLYGSFNNNQTRVIKVNKGTHFKDVDIVKPDCEDGYVFNSFIHNGKSDDFIIDKDVEVFAKYSEYETTPKSFANDNWTTLCAVAERGYDKLVSTYSNCAPFNEKNSEGVTKWDAWGKSFYINNFEDAEEVAAKTRYVTLDILNTNTLTYDYAVRVIGDRHDEIPDMPVKTTAALTFEFEDIVFQMAFNKSGDNYWYEWDEGTLHESHIRQYLVTGLPYSFPKELADRIKTVNKITRKAGTSEKEPETYITKEKIFMCSSTEINVADEKFPQVEGELYEFYRMWPHRNIHIFKYGGVDCGYFLRSPSYTSAKNLVDMIKSTGGRAWGYPQYEQGVVPAFCVGQDSGESK